MSVRASDILYTMPRTQTKVTEATGDKTECVKNKRGKKQKMRDPDPNPRESQILTLSN